MADDAFDTMLSNDFNNTDPTAYLYPSDVNTNPSLPEITVTSTYTGGSSGSNASVSSGSVLTPVVTTAQKIPISATTAATSGLASWFTPSKIGLLLVLGVGAYYVMKMPRKRKQRRRR